MRSDATLAGSVETHAFRDDGAVPNSVLPLIVRRAAIPLDGPDPAGNFVHVFSRNGWTGAWRNGIFDYHHYHSTAHEVLGIASGRVIVRFGGAQGRDVSLAPGDVAVLPAGMGHRCVRREGDLLVVGAYAEGRRWDVVRAEPNVIAAARLRIAQVPLPSADPVEGAGGPLLEAWRSARR